MLPPRPGYVQRVELDGLAEGLGAARRAAWRSSSARGLRRASRRPIAEVWPAERPQDCRRELLAAISIASERDLDQDVDFGIRQLADTAIKAMSPGINDPATAVTCIGYLRSILVRLTERADPPAVRRFSGTGAHRDRPSAPLRRVPRGDARRSTATSAGDAWVAGTMLEALQSCASSCPALRRRLSESRSIHDVAATIAEQAAEQAGNERDRRRIDRLMADIAAADAG